MPSQRKRIGFLPSEEVHDIIDTLCKSNNYSQSKVTGLLVEEALRSRGLVNNSFVSNSSNSNILSNSNLNNYYENKNFSSNINSSGDLNLLSKNKININEELNMINDFMEYKFFKRVMNKNKSVFD